MMDLCNARRACHAFIHAGKSKLTARMRVSGEMLMNFCLMNCALLQGTIAARRTASAR